MAKTIKQIFQIHRKTIYPGLCLIFISITIISLFTGNPLYADEAPPSPQQFYGTVTDNGTALGSGYTVVAKVNGTQVASGITDSQGRYGYSPLFLVVCSQGQAIEFFVNGIKASENATCSPGSMTPLNLTIIGTPPPLQTIATGFPGKSDNITLTNNILSAAKELSSADGRVRLSFAANTTINLQGQTALGAATESNPNAAADNSTMIRAYSFTPAGATFSPAATMTLKYETPLPSGISESGLYIAYWTGSSWQSLTSTVNTTAKEVSASVSHFTIFAIRCIPSQAVPPPAPPPPAPTTTAVTTDILGTSGSFSLSSGTLVSATSVGSADGRISISLAANTAINLQGSQQLTVVQLASPPAPPANAKTIAAYTFGPDNANFSPALTITIKYNLSDIPAGVSESSLYIALLEGTNWTELPSTVNTQNKTVAAQVSHFSTYAVLGKVAPTPTPTPTPAMFTLSDLTITPEVAKAGEQVTVSVRVVNSSATEGIKTVVLKINDKDEAQKEVTLAPGKSQAVTFTVSKSDPGSYRVSTEGLSAKFEVKATASGGGQPASSLSIPILIVIVAGGLLVIILVVVLIFRQRSSGY